MMLPHPRKYSTNKNWEKQHTTGQRSLFNIKENIETAALDNQSNIDLELPEIWILLPVLISPINSKQTLLLEHNMND